MRTRTQGVTWPGNQKLHSKWEKAQKPLITKNGSTAMPIVNGIKANAHCSQKIQGSILLYRREQWPHAAPKEQ
jgi:hypothetical protein